MSDTSAPEESGNPDDNATEQFKQRVAEASDGVDDIESEEELWNGGYSQKAMLGTWIFVILLAVVAIAASIAIAAIPVWVGIAVAAVVLVLAMFVFAYRRLSYHYTLTTQRFIHRSGLLTRRTDRIEVIDIDDVTYVQGPIQRILGIGTIEILSSDRTSPELRLLGIDQVERVSGMIDDIRRKERRKRGLHIEAI